MHFKHRNYAVKRRRPIKSQADALVKRSASLRRWKSSDTLFLKCTRFGSVGKPKPFTYPWESRSGHKSQRRNGTWQIVNTVSFSFPLVVEFILQNKRQTRKPTISNKRRCPVLNENDNLATPPAAAVATVTRSVLSNDRMREKFADAIGFWPGTVAPARYSNDLM